jgi:hypothetical protein
MTRLPTIQQAPVCRMFFRRADTGRNACALDVADVGETDLSVIAAMFGTTPERIAQVAVKALEKAHRRARLMRLGHLIDAKVWSRTSPLPPARDIRRRGALSASVLVILHTGAASIQALAAATSSSHKSIRKTLARLSKKRLAVRTGDTWSLAS